MDIRLERLSVRGFVITTNTKNWGTSNREMPIVARGSHTVEDTLIQVLEGALIDEEVMAINKEKHYEETDRKIQDQDETAAHDAFVDLGNANANDTLKKAENNFIPKTAVQKDWTMIWVIIALATGIVIGIAIKSIPW
jgi:hypothetical protein